MQPKLIKLIFIILLAIGCKSKKHEVPSAHDSPTPQTTTESISNEKQTFSSQPVQDDEQSYYADGDYCATVRYSNPNTGTRSIYILNVEVEDGKLVKIHWPNGGWLDDSHFDPPHINESGFTTFTADNGYEYDVLIKSEGQCDYADSHDFNEFSQKNPVYTEKSTTDGDDEETSLEDKYGSIKAAVYKRVSGCDYMILEERGDYYVVEWMGGYDPDEGDRIQGDLRHYGTKTCYVLNRERESRLYVDDYEVSLSDALHSLKDKCNIDDEDDDNDNN